MTTKKIRYSKQFTRRYKERIAKDERLKQELRDSVDAFQVDRSLVNDHALEEDMVGQRSFSINDDYRVIYIENDEEIVFMDVGTHEQVYRRRRGR